jgi:hypothetical protein
MSWQGQFTLWMLSVISYAFVSLVCVAVLKRAVIAGLKEVVLFYFTEKVKWLEEVEKKFGGKGSQFGSALH